MKKVANAFRVINTDGDRKKLLELDAFLRVQEKQAVYEHNNIFYRYFGTVYYIDYFEEILEPPQLGIEIRDLMQ